MEKELSLTSSFPPDQAQKVDNLLSKLLPHLQQDRFWVVGGLAIRFHLATHNIDYPVKEFNDLDLKAEHSSVVLPSVTQDFLIYHYHLQPEDHFYIVLIDPETKIKVDIFDPTIPVLRSTTASFQEHTFKLRSPEDQLTKTVFDINRISRQAKVDPKQFTETKLLSQISDMELADQLWKQRHFKEYSPSIQEAIDRAETIAKGHPDWIKQHPFKRPQPYDCPDCISTPNFPLTPMPKIYRILGYVE